MRKGVKKAHLSITIDKKLLAELRGICEREDRKMSPLVEKLVRKGLER